MDFKATYFRIFLKKKKEFLFFTYIKGYLFE